MKAVVLTDLGRDNLRIEDRPDPVPGAGEVLVRMRAASLNYRDLVVVEGGYGSRQRTSDLIPLSDGAGEVAAVGDGVVKFRVGDRVAGNLFPNWVSGKLTEEKMQGPLGGGSDGVLCEYRVFHEDGILRIPDHLDYRQAAALPCAALTAWSAVVTQGRVAPGDTVLTQGTGGVSLFALQFAKLAGARVIATSSTDEKLARVRDLGADHVINYRTTPEWGREAVSLTGGRGVDHVVEVGGAGTLRQSLRAVRTGGVISLIGVLSGAKHEIMLPFILTRNIRVQGVTVGSLEMFAAMLRAIEQARLTPVLDQVFPMQRIADAMAHLAAGAHFGKVIIDI